MQEEILRLEKDNNRMLHSMRRSAFWGGVFKAIFWLAIIIAPIWFYSVYLAPVVQSFQNTVNQVQTTSTNAQAQINGFGASIKQLQDKAMSVFQAQK